MKKLSSLDLWGKFFDIIAPSLTVIILVFLAILCRPDLIADTALYESTPVPIVFSIFLCGVLMGTFFCLVLRFFLELVNFLHKYIKKVITKEDPK